MKRTLVSVVSLLVLLAVGIGVGSLHYRHSTSIRELGARLDTLSREVSDLRTELSVRKPSEISAEQRKAILQVIADDRTEQKRQQVEDQQKRVLHLSLACADRFAEKYALTADQRTAFLEVLRLSREKLEALEKQLSELQLAGDLDATISATNEAYRNLKAWQLDELTKRLGSEVAHRVNEDTELSVLANVARVEASKQIR